MKIPCYHIDAFTDQIFKGNPAAVCILENWPKDEVLQNIAAENRLSETAFVVEAINSFELRWFTPKLEVDLCGHGTLATAFVMFKYAGITAKEIVFQTKSGPLKVTKDKNYLVLDFPSKKPKPCEAPKLLIAGLGKKPAQVLESRDYVAVFDSEDEVAGLTPDFSILSKLDAFGVIATAPGKKCDFVSRFFAPRAGVDEDPVTGSAHCILIPYWSERLNKQSLVAFQISERGGELRCQDMGDRVKIAGRAVPFLAGIIDI